MKKKLRVIIITLVLLTVATGAFIWKMNDISNKMKEQEQALLKEERDLLEEQKGKVIDEINSVDIIPLTSSGNQKNVITTPFSSLEEVYSPVKSAQVEENLTNIKKNKSFTIKSPLFAYNPFGTNPHSMYVYFETSGNCYLRYTISVDDKNIPDFTRTAYSKDASGASKEHEHQLVGLVAGQKNYITMKLYNKENELSEVKTFSFDVPAGTVGAKNVLASKKGISKKNISNGLYILFGKGNAKKNAIMLYDNSGVLRSEFPTEKFIGRNIENIYGNLTYAVSDHQIVQVNSLGEVVKCLNMAGYSQAGDFAYDGYGNIYTIATANRKKTTKNSKILRTEIETGKVSQVLDMDKILKSVYKKAAKKAGKKTVNWIDLNSLQVVGNNKLLLSSKKLSSIFKISNVGSLMPKIEYIIADKNIYKSNKALYKKVLKKAKSSNTQATKAPKVNNILEKKVVPDPFVSQYGQEAIKYTKKTNTSYLLSMLSANTGSEGDENSYYLVFDVNESGKSYKLKNRNLVSKNKNDGNYILKGDTYIYCNSDINNFKEAEVSGKIIKEFTPQFRTFRVYKIDFKNFWFR